MKILKETLNCIISTEKISKKEIFKQTKIISAGLTWKQQLK